MHATVAAGRLALLSSFAHQLAAQDSQALEAHLHSDFPSGPPNPTNAPSAYWAGPRRLAGDDGRLYDSVAETLGRLSWKSLTTVRSCAVPSCTSVPTSVRWVLWVLPDEPFHLGNLLIA
jgi:hypothetical protein